MKSHNICLSVFGLFHSACYPTGSSMLLQMAGFPSLWLCIYMYVCVMFSFFSSFFLSFWLHCVACEILLPWPGIEPMPLAVETWTPSHWITKESHVSCFLYSFIHWWMLRLFPYLGYSEQCCSEHVGAGISSRHWFHFLWIYTQKWGSWIIW